MPIVFFRFLTALDGHMCTCNVWRKVSEVSFYIKSQKAQYNVADWLFQVIQHAVRGCLVDWSVVLSLVVFHLVLNLVVQANGPWLDWHSLLHGQVTPLVRSIRSSISAWIGVEVVYCVH